MRWSSRGSSHAASESELRAIGETVRETVDRCERLIEGLLMLARSEASSGRGEDVDIAAVVADCVTDLSARAQEAHVEIATDLGEAWTRGEPALLERMVANLVDNGIRHNEPGGYLRVRTSSADGRASVVVGNGGPVIDPQQAPALTEPFRRLGRGASGFGLGLSIVRSVALAHGGTVELRAPEEGGLEVRVELPAVPAPPGGVSTPTVPRLRARDLR